MSNCLPLAYSIPVVLLNSPILSPYFSLNKLERSLLLIFSKLFCLIISHFFYYHMSYFYVLCKEKLGVNNWLGLKGLRVASCLVRHKGKGIQCFILFSTSQNYRYRYFFLKPTELRKYLVTMMPNGNALPHDNTVKQTIGEIFFSTNVPFSFYTLSWENKLIHFCLHLLTLRRWWQSTGLVFSLEWILGSLQN